MWWFFFYAIIILISFLISNHDEKCRFSSTEWREEQKRKATMANKQMEWRKWRDRLVILERKAAMFDDKHLPINIDMALSFLREEGFEAEPIDNAALSFKYQGDKYVLWITPEGDRIQLFIVYSSDDSLQELLEAAMQTMANIQCCKIVIMKDCSMVFTVDTFVDWTIFTACFNTYLGILEEAQRYLYNCLTRGQSEDESSWRRRSGSE